jgi:hypothetical protein
LRISDARQEREGDAFVIGFRVRKRDDMA